MRRAKSSHVFAFAFFVFGLALLLRVGFLSRVSPEPVWDGHYYDFGARRLALGLGYSDDLHVGETIVWHPWCHYPVGYSAWLAVFYRVFGLSARVAAFANVIAGSLLAPVVYGLARFALSERRARLASFCVALFPGLVVYSVLTMSELLAALGVLVSFLVGLAIEKRFGRASGIAIAAAAILLGVTALVRPQVLLCAPFLLRFGPPLTSIRAVARSLAFLGVFTLLPIAPWTARNCRVMDGCALVSTNGGWNLAIGTFPRATGRFETLRASDGCDAVRGQVDQDRCWFRYGVSQIRQHPAFFVGLIAKKMQFTFDHESFAVEYLSQSNAEVVSEPLRTRAREVLTWLHRVLMFFAAVGGSSVGLARWPRARVGALGALLLLLAAVLDSGRGYWMFAVISGVAPLLSFRLETARVPCLLGGLVAMTALVHGVFFGEDRYHLFLTPALIVLAAHAFASRRDFAHRTIARVTSRSTGASQSSRERALA